MGQAFAPEGMNGRPIADEKHGGNRRSTPLCRRPQDRGRGGSMYRSMCPQQIGGIELRAEVLPTDAR
jgi:hypothetical protein